MKHRSQTLRERRKKDQAIGRQKEENGSFKVVSFSIV